MRNSIAIVLLLASGACKGKDKAAPPPAPAPPAVAKPTEPAPAATPPQNNAFQCNGRSFSSGDVRRNVLECTGDKPRIVLRSTETGKLVDGPSAEVPADEFETIWKQVVASNWETRDATCGDGKGDLNPITITRGTTSCTFICKGILGKPFDDVDASLETLRMRMGIGYDNVGADGDDLEGVEDGAVEEHEAREYDKMRAEKRKHKKATKKPTQANGTAGPD